MAWVRVNAETNPTRTTFPETAVIGSLFTLQQSIGTVEYRVESDGLSTDWMPYRALTDIEMYISDINGQDEFGRGTEAQPFTTLEFAVSMLPKYLKNVTIHIVRSSIPGDGNHNAYGLFSDFIKIDPSNTITIIGSPRSVQETSFSVTNVGLILGDSFRQLTLAEPIESSSYDMTVNLAIASYGTDADSGYQYVLLTGQDAYFMDVAVGYGVVNAANNAIAYVTGSENVGDDARIYLSTPIFTANGQFINIYKPTDEINFVECTSSTTPNKDGVVWPVYAITPTTIVVPNSPAVNPIAGDSFRGVSLNPCTFEFVNIDHNVTIARVDNSYHDTAETDYTLLANVRGRVSFEQCKIQKLTVDKSPYVTFNKTLIVDTLAIGESFSYQAPWAYSPPNDDFGSIVVYEGFNPSVSCVILSSILTITDLQLYKSALALKRSTILCSRTSSGNLINMEHAYLELDSTSMITDARILDGTVTAIRIGENSSVYQQPENEVRFFNTPVTFTTVASSGLFRAPTYKTYSSRLLMLKDKTVPNGVIGTVDAEPGNIYLRQDNMWVVMSGNRYETADLPSSTDFYTPVGLEIFNITLGREMTWS